MNDFGEMSSTGAVLSNTEMKELRLKRGECPTCGERCYKKSLFKQTPITIHGRVLNGRCLICKPLQRDEVECLPAEVRAASQKDMLKAKALSFGSYRQQSPTTTGFLGEEDRILRRSTGGVSINNSMSMSMNGQEFGGHLSSSPDEHYYPTRQGMGNNNDDYHHLSSRSTGFESDQSFSSNASLRSIPEQHDGAQHSSTKTPFIEKRGRLRKQTSDKSSSGKKNFRSIISKKRWGSQSSLSATPEVTEKTSNNINSNANNNNYSNNNNANPDSKLSYSESIELQALDKLSERDNSVDFILETAMTFPRTKEIQLKAMAALSNAIVRNFNDDADTNYNNEDKNSNLIRHGDNIQVVMNAMDSFQGEEELQLNCCSVLQNLSVVEEMHQIIANHGGINCVINAMEAYPKNVHIQQNAIGVLMRIGQKAKSNSNGDSNSDDNQLKILKRGGDKRIVEAMVNHNESLDIMSLGCMAIVNLAAEDYSLKTGIVESSGADQIIIAMVVHSHDVNFLINCCCALRTLSSGHDENKSKIVEKGGIDSIVSVMQLYKNNLKMQEVAASTLCELGSIPETALSIGKCGGIDVLIRALWLHSDNSNVKLECCCALEILSRCSQNNNSKNNNSVENVENVALMLEIGAISAVIHTMQQSTEDSRVQESCCGILYNLACDSEYVKARIVEEEALDAISISMVLHKNVKALQQKACRVLNNLICEETLDAIQAANVPELMNVAAFNFPSECNKEACFMVNTLERMARI